MSWNMGRYTALAAAMAFLAATCLSCSGQPEDPEVPKSPGGAPYIYALQNAKTAQAEASIFRLINNETWWYCVRCFDTAGRELDVGEEDLASAVTIEIEWDDGSKIRTRVKDPENIWILLGE